MYFKELLFSLYKKSIKSMSKGHGIGRYHLVKKTLRIIQNSLRSDCVIVQGNTMYLDKNDSLSLAVNNVYSEFEMDVIRNRIKKGDSVLDIGAHIGYFTLIFAESVGNDGKVFAFEPEPTNFELLKKNVKINNYHNIVLEQKAVSDRNGRCELFVGQRSSGANRIYEPKKTRTQEFKLILVDSIKLDDYFKDKSIGKIDFIKMDVEGAELLALYGMRNILKENPDIVIITEFLKNSIEDAGLNPKEMLDFLYSQGFTIYLVDEQKKKILPINIEDLLTSKFENRTINLLCERSH